MCDCFVFGVAKNGALHAGLVVLSRNCCTYMQCLLRLAGILLGASDLQLGVLTVQHEASMGPVSKCGSALFRLPPLGRVANELYREVRQH